MTGNTYRTAGVIRFAVWLTFFNTWVLFEETVVDRYGWWEYMPYYRVGQLCSWDIGAMALIGFFVWRAFRRGSALRASSALRSNVPSSAANGAHILSSQLRAASPTGCSGLLIRLARLLAIERQLDINAMLASQLDEGRREVIRRPRPLLRGAIVKKIPSG